MSTATEEQQTTEAIESNFDDDAVAAALTSDAEGRLRRDYDHRVSQLTYQVSDNEENLRHYTRIIREVNESLGRQRASLREIQANPPVVPDAETIARDVRRMRSFNGVTGLRVDEFGRIVASVHTSVIFKNRRYHMGDYDIVLGQPRSDYGVLDITCTASGQLLHSEETHCAHGWDSEVLSGYTSHFYWSGYGPAGVGTGSFCFGTRAGEIRRLRDQGRYAELLHLVLASMCSVNSGSERSLEHTYKSVRCGPKRVTRLRRAGAAIIGINREA